MEVLVSPTGTQVIVANTDCVAKADASTGPLCYDYNEQFDREALCNQDIPLGFVHRIKAMLEECATVEQASMKVEVDVIQDIAEVQQEVTELPEKLSSIEVDHSSKASDGKSFKAYKESDSKSCKVSDGKSFNAWKDTVTPDRVTPIPTPRPSSRPSSRPASKPSSRPTSAMASASSSTETIPRPPCDSSTRVELFQGSTADPSRCRPLSTSVASSAIHQGAVYIKASGAG